MRGFLDGVMDTALAVLSVVAVGGAVLLLVVLLVGALTSGSERDSTDPPGGRSGMALHIDHATGCEYLSKSRGGITPRLDGQGRHMGCRP